ncbi:hypothetical protein MMC13_000911 [Lambiella insularis]|nr:hypothetical protein [Lambiella insularis]
MASRVKKLFHKKDEDSELTQQHSDSLQRTPLSKEGLRDLAFRQSLYETATPGQEPVVGTYPQAGNNTTGSSARNSLNLPRGHHLSSSTDYTSPKARQQDALPSEFSGLSLGHSGRDSTIRPVPSETAPGISRSDPQQAHALGDNDIDNNQWDGNEIASSSRRTGALEPRRFQHSAGGTARDTARDSRNSQQQQDLSIPRKTVGSGSVLQSSEDAASFPLSSKSHARQPSLQKPLPNAPYESQALDRRQAQSESIPGQTHAQNTINSARPNISSQEVLDRAQGNTHDTEVIEKIAPAVVHETMNKDIHHIRHEVVTREIHEHTYYHRILPVIDVEVLPPRHFLPVEGGGLVEVSADEVPGRGKNWVIAETASKIPSSGALPSEPRVFSAREFRGTEGDDKRFITPEGYERTEQTWVHPPELETLSEASGQTWPMEFGKDENPRLLKTQAPNSPNKGGKRKGILKQPASRSDEHQKVDAATTTQQSSMPRSEMPKVAGPGARPVDPRSLR